MLHDLRFAFRMLVKSPGVAAIAALTLALGIGATTTVFCWMQSIILHPLSGVDRQEQMVVLTTQHGTTMWDCVSPPDAKDLQELKDVFAGIIGSQITPACLTVDGNSEWFTVRLRRRTSSMYSVSSRCWGARFSPKNRWAPAVIRSSS
jgi:hypothetical protein